MNCAHLCFLYGGLRRRVNPGPNADGRIMAKPRWVCDPPFLQIHIRWDRRMQAWGEGLVAALIVENLGRINFVLVFGQGFGDVVRPIEPATKVNEFASPRAKRPIRGLFLPLDAKLRPAGWTNEFQRHESTAPSNPILTWVFSWPACPDYLRLSSQCRLTWTPS